MVKELRSFCIRSDHSGPVAAIAPVTAKIANIELDNKILFLWDTSNVMYLIFTTNGGNGITTLNGTFGETPDTFTFSQDGTLIISSEELSPRTTLARRRSSFLLMLTVITKNPWRLCRPRQKL